MYRPGDANLWLYRLLCALLLGLYSLVVYALTAVVATWPLRPLTALDQIPWWSSAAPLALFVATCVPATTYLRYRVHPLVYGQHDDAYALAERLSRHLHEHLHAPNADTLLPDALLRMLTATLADTLNLPYVALTLEPRGPPPAAHPPPGSVHGAAPGGAEIVTLPLRYRDLELGTLQVSSRRSRERLSAADLRLLRDLARQVGITLHAAELTEALQTSRAQLVTAREEERRRIRRDLHDGLGPTLASLHLQLAALRRTVRRDPVRHDPVRHDPVRHDPAAADARLGGLQDDLRSATAEVRRLVCGLRPPRLDELGLVGALRHLELGDGLTRTVEAPEPFPPLPAALEVALYRIAAEALHNVLRHARATDCTVHLAVDPARVTLTVTDNGCGLPSGYLAGVGHRSMGERAAELGGSVSVSARPAGGTRVVAVFPLERTLHWRTSP